jgi:hypothetical protein
VADPRCRTWRLSLLAGSLLSLLSPRGAQPQGQEPPAAQRGPTLPAPFKAEAIEPGDARVPLTAESEAIVEPGATFRVLLPGRSEDARLSLLDSNDGLVPSTTTREVGEQTVLTLAPRQPLAPATRYLLRLDGVRSRDLHDAAGRAAGPVDLPLAVAGSTPEPARKAVRRRSR